MALFRLNRVSLAFGDLPVFTEVDFAIEPGERVCLIGRNGAGKTTLVNAIFNLGPQVRGSIRVLGRDVAGWPTHRIARLGIALVPQGRGIFPDLTVTENLRLATLGRRRGPWTFDRIFALFPRLAERRAAMSGALSGGERQMLAVGRALLTQASILVLDEPSEGLAPPVAEEVIVTTLGSLAAEGKTVLLVEQNLPLTLRACERAVVLAGGRIVFDGPSVALQADAAILGRHLGV